MKFKVLIALIIFVCYTNIVFSQSSLSGLVLSGDDEVQAYATVLLLSEIDSSLVKGAITDEEGVFEINNLKEGKYFLAVSLIGFKTTYSPLITLGVKDHKIIENLKLDRLAKELTEVEIIASKPFFEWQIDRMVINVANSITSAGSNALEVLARSPGVTVNELNNSLGLGGKQGAIIMIDGKISRMPKEALLGMLKGMDANNIQKIELFDTPPAQFDSEGNAGIINIVLKKNKADGSNGTYSLNTGYGKHLRYGGTINFNHRKDKTNIYGSYSYHYQLSKQEYRFSRVVQLDDGRIIQTKSKNERLPENNNHNIRLGFDYDINKKTVLGVLFSGYLNLTNNISDNNSVFSEMNTPFSIVQTINNENNDWKHGMANLNLQHSFRKDEHLNFDIDYLYYDNNNPSNYINDFFDGENNLIESSRVKIKKVSPISNISTKIDYHKSFNEKIQWQAGIKGTSSLFSNLIEVEDLIGNNFVPNEMFSQDYKLEEKIGAIYSSLNAQIDDKTTMILGLRYEYTDYLLATQDHPRFIDREFGNFFPSLFLSRNLNKLNRITFSASRRIKRPAFSELAPFVTFVDPNTFFNGNPELRPGLSNLFKLDYKFKNILFSLKHSEEKDFIAAFQPVLDTETNTQIYTTLNLDKEQITSLTISLPLQPVKWWEIQNSAVFSFEEITVEGQLKDGSLKQNRYIFDMIHTFSLPKKFVIEIAGKYQNEGYFGLLKVQPKGFVNLGLRKRLSKNKGTFSLTFSDIFRNNIWRSVTEIPELNLENSLVVDVETRIIRLTFSSTFGNSNVKKERRRATSSEEHRRRIY